MIWPLNTLAPLASLISTLCGMPASLLSNSSTNAWPAAASRWLVSNAMFCAEMWSVAPVVAGLPPATGTAEAGAVAGATFDSAGPLGDGLMSIPGIVAVDDAGGAYVYPGAPAAFEQAATT